MYWMLTNRTDEDARKLADRHYSRKHPGATEFCPPGHNIVLISPEKDALWVSHRPAPKANLKRPRFDGFDYWDNPYFRNENKANKSSEMIREAIAITLYFWGELIPVDGFHSFINPKRIDVRSRPGECFLWAGFRDWGTLTEKGLLRLYIPQFKLARIAPVEPMRKQLVFNF